MGAYLWIYWRFVTGTFGSPLTADWRREYARANRVLSTVWPVVLLTGVVGFAALIAFVRVLARLVALPSSTPIVTPPGMSTPSMFTLLVMGSVVAGVTEEVAFRGYMQTPLERQYGLAAAIVICGIAFGVLHFPEPPRPRHGDAALLHCRDGGVCRDHERGEFDPAGSRPARRRRRVVVDTVMGNRRA